ncbi:MAG: Molybdopterin synthase catalytic subunit [Thelocarpon superellum]|nr:MAG: Molybdopterin synthase catalytic subunit [Thelocarpon superellum]
MADGPTPPATHTRSEGPVTVSLTEAPLSVPSVMDQVRSPRAGAIVLFVGTTRDSFDAKPVQSLTYTAYVPLALHTLRSVAQAVHVQHGLTGIAITHRLGEVPIGQESIIIAVSAPHRHEAWRAAQAALEECKAKVEVWKREEFADGGVWRANRDGIAGRKAQGKDGTDTEGAKISSHLMQTMDGA